MTPGEQYRFGPYDLDAAERELRRDHEVIATTAKAFDLLLILVRGAGRTFTKSELLATLWPDTVVEESNLSQTVFLLRKALAENGAEDDSAYILTVPKRGYKFIGSVTRLDNGDGSRVLPTSPPARWLWPSVAAAMAAAALGFAVLWLRQPVPLDLSTYRYRPFAYTLGHEDSGTWSPDGKNIAFLQGEGSSQRLMVQPSDGGGATEVVKQVKANFIAWSSDGARIYFDGKCGIYSVSRAGGQPELVLAGTYAAFNPSPDGKALALWRTTTAAGGSDHGSVWISSPPGAEPREYTPAPFSTEGGLGLPFLQFSPNGKLLYLSMLSRSSREIWLLPFPAGTGSPRRVFRNVKWERPVWASWMPDSRRVVLAPNISPSVAPALWLADIRDESLTQLTDGSIWVHQPAVSPDGRRLLFTRTEADADIVELPVDGSLPRNLLATGIYEYSPAWSPKSGEFAYLKRPKESDELWLRSSIGEWERPVVTEKEIPGLAELVNPVISPDGSRIAYSAILKGQGQLMSLYISPTAGGAPTQISTGGGASWSPDSASIAYRWIKPGGRFVLATLRVGSNQPPFEVVDVGCTTTFPEWSPSGEWIACGTAGGPLLVSPDGKVKRTLPRLNAAALAWSKDGKTLYGLHGENGHWSLLAADVRSGAIRKVADYGRGIRPFNSSYNVRLSLSADGANLAIGTLKSENDLWILEGFSSK